MNTTQDINSVARLRLVVLCAILAVTVGGAAWTSLGKDKVQNPPAKLKVDDQPITRDGNLTVSFAPVVKSTAPSVVNIFTTKESRVIRSPMNPFFEDPMMRRFFGVPDGYSERKMRTPKQQGLGSGVIVTEDGYILTNHHVVKDADEIQVGLNSGKAKYKARVVGADPKSDIAVLKVDAKDLPAATLGDSKYLEIGDVVLAIGNPFGVGQSVTMGIVSATGRSSVGLELDYANFIQTDAAINPGNSGGALVDGQGRLVGINTAILSRSGGNNGIGFAIPISMARNVMENLIQHGKVVRGFLGVNIQNVTTDLAEAFEIEDLRGALVSEVHQDTPADKAGIESGDIIVEFDGKKIRDSHQLKMEVSSLPPGREVPVKILRDGKEKSLKVKLQELPETGLAGVTPKPSEPSDSLDGVVVSELDQSVRAQLNAPDNLEGVVVTDVDPQSPAYEAGLRKGDIIREINRRPVESVEEAMKLTENVEDKRILLRVWSKGGSRYLVVDERQAG